MKQILQSFKTGKTELVEVPSPIVKKGHVLIKTTRSLVSLGTEKMLVEFGKASLIEKARQQPDKVKMVLDKVKSDGLLPTLETVFNKLEQPLPLGYCNVGKVIDVGEGVEDFKIGDRVASNGQHAEFVCIPKNLVAHVPENISDEEASFTVIGSIGLQGIRLINPTFGETIVVVGLGLIGLITAELLMSNGCKVIGYDLDESKLKIAKDKGITAFNPSKGNNPVDFVMSHTHGIGADGVIITASAKTNEIISQAAQMSRKRGRIILVGVIGLDISRADFYEKELSFQVSCSYGPGRYDDDYEQKGKDYPLAFVRWTEKRNFEAILEAISTRKLDVKSLITDTVSIDDFDTVYGNISTLDSIATIFKYSKESDINSSITVSDIPIKKNKGGIAIIGAGNFTKMTVLPALVKTNANIEYIISAGGVNSTALAKKHNIRKSATDFDVALNDENVDLVIITTRHNLHAQMVIESLQKDKHVFVEKPLVLNFEELNEVIKAYQSKNNKSIVVGYNRRFSPHTRIIKKHLSSNQPMNIIATMNAGAIPQEVWVHDMKIGGGRIIGEACHYIDLLIHLTSSKVVSVCMNALGTNPKENTDNASILLKFENGSNGVINYFSNGSKSYSKERIEVYQNEKIFVTDNFRTTKAFGVKNFSKLKTKQDKGHSTQFKELINSLEKESKPIIPFDEIINSTQATLRAIESLKQGKWINIDEKI